MVYVRLNPYQPSFSEAAHTSLGQPAARRCSVGRHHEGQGRFLGHEAGLGRAGRASARQAAAVKAIAEAASAHSRGHARYQRDTSAFVCVVKAFFFGKDEFEQV